MSTQNYVHSDILPSNWQCRIEHDQGIEYYELRFSSDNNVEGWLKRSNSTCPVNVFTACLIQNHNLFEIEKDDESFTAACVGNHLIAFIDDQLMVFNKVA
ncbi:MAG: hypothetical protein OXC03_08075 [Flavobacteriaceae bacterium]|nr:hypothetical protein [Flavobacteriaceae bacterium]